MSVGGVWIGWVLLRWVGVITCVFWDSFFEGDVYCIFTEEIGFFVSGNGGWGWKVGVVIPMFTVPVVYLLIFYFRETTIYFSIWCKCFF
jgi:hypothetical protein